VTAYKPPRAPGLRRALGFKCDGLARSLQSGKDDTLSYADLRLHTQAPVRTIHNAGTLSRYAARLLHFLTCRSQASSMPHSSPFSPPTRCTPSRCISETGFGPSPVECYSPSLITKAKLGWYRFPCHVYVTTYAGQSYV
jgi:hypothetical protein